MSGHLRSAGGQGYHRKRVAQVMAWLLLAGMSCAAGGQALPAAEASPISTGFSLPTTSGSLTYGLSASESLNWGFYANGTRTESTNVNGQMGFISTSKRSPFSAVLAAWHAFGTGGQPSYNFVSAGVSQVLAVKRWNFVLADNLSYLPQTPAVGYSGVPGIGDIGIGSAILGVIPTSVIAQPTQGVLTNYANRIDNNASVSFGRQLTGKTTLHGSADYAISRFTQDTGALQNSGLDTNGISGAAGVSHAYNRRTSLGGTFSYSDYSYVGNFGSIGVSDFKTESATADLTRQFSRKLTGSISAGPQWTTIESGTDLTSLGVFVNAVLSYQAEHSNSTLAFVRSTNTGYGVIGGALSDAVTYTGSKTLARVWAAGLTASYTDTTSLGAASQAAYQFHTAVVGAQISRALPHSLSAFASYSLQSQTNSGPLLSILDVFSGHFQTLGLGLTYSPRAIHFGGH